MEHDFQHFVLTRYFTKWGESAAGIREVLQPDRTWLDGRLEIFRKYCFPSVTSQSLQNFTWLIYFDVNTPADYLDEVRALIGTRDNVKIVICEDFGQAVRAKSINDEIKSPTKWLLTTRLDSDDGWHRDFVKVLQSNLTFDERHFLNFPVGIVYFDEKTFLYRHASNAFISLLEPAGECLTAFCVSHPHANSIAPVVQLPRMPAFLQVVHGRNKSNKPRGVRVPISLARAGFDAIFGPVGSEPPEGDWTIVAYNMGGPLIWMLRDRAVAIVRSGMGALKGKKR